MYQCQNKCSVEIHAIFENDLNYADVYRVHELQLTMGGLTWTHKVCQFVFRHWTATIKIICSTSTHGKKNLCH